MTLVLGPWGAATFFAVALVMVAMGLLFVLLAKSFGPFAWLGLFWGVLGGSLLIVLCQGVA